MKPWEKLLGRVRDAVGMAELASEEGGAGLTDDLESEVDSIASELHALERRMALSGEYDSGDAILAIHAGAGGTDAQDWTEMLVRMYLRWAESRGFRTRILDTSPGEEAGLKSATVEVGGPYAYGYLNAEGGVHRLVRVSPFDSAGRRHTSFALVEVLPDLGDEVRIQIDPDDLRIDTFKSSSAGGQHVNKTASAVRITHLPTGIVVACQNERSQSQNRQTAMKVLRARLLEQELRKRREEQVRVRGEHVSAEWGNQIRSYVLYPYTLVKDHRTGREVHNADAVLDGDLDGFIDAYLQTTVGGNGQR